MIEFTRYENNKRVRCNTAPFKGYVNLEFIEGLLLDGTSFTITGHQSQRDVTKLSLASIASRAVNLCQDSSKVRKAVRTLIKELR